MELRDQGNSATLALAAPPAEPDAETRLCDWLLAEIDRHRKWLFVGLLCLYLLGFNGQWRIERDSALYLTVGRNLADGDGYTYLGQPHRLAFPGLPLLFAGIFRTLHTTVLFPPLLVMLLLGFCALGLTYRLFLLHSGRPTAVVMMLGLGMTRLFYRYAFELLSDMPFLVGVMAFMVGYEAVFFARYRNGSTSGRNRPCLERRAEPADVRWYDWVLLIGGLVVAIIMRPAMWVLLAAVVLALCWSAIRGTVSWKQILVSLFVLGAAAAAFYSIDPRHSGSGTMGQYEDYLFEAKFARLGPMLHEMFHSNIPEIFEAAGVKALFGCPLLPGLNSLGGLVLIGLSVWLLWHRALWGLWALLTILMLFLFKPLDRYFLPVIPLLVFAWWKLLVYINHRLPPHWGNKVFLGLLLLGGGTNLARLGEIVVEQRRVPFLEHYHDGRYASVHQVRKFVAGHTARRSWILVEPKVGRILTYLTSRYAIEPGENTKLNPSAQVVYALLGPSWDEHPTNAAGDAAASPGSEDPVAAWVARRGFVLGPTIGASIQGAHDREAWTLHRVLKIPG